MGLNPSKSGKRFKPKPTSSFFGGFWTYKSGLRIFVGAPKVSVHKQNQRISTSAASVHKQHQRISSVRASAAPANQLHQRISKSAAAEHQ